MPTAPRKPRAVKAAPAAADALEVAQAEAADTGYGSVTIGTESFVIERKPPMLMLSEMARTSTGDPEAVGVIAEFFQTVLADYPAFKRALYATEDPDEEMSNALQVVMEKTLGRPTE